MTNFPSSSVAAPMEVPLITTLAPTNGPPVSWSVIVPFSLPDVAPKANDGTNNITIANKKNL